MGEPARAGDDPALENAEHIWTVPEIVETGLALDIPVITDAFHHLNPGGLALAPLGVEIG